MNIAMPPIPEGCPDYPRLMKLENQASSVGMAPAHDEVESDEIVVLPDPIIRNTVRVSSEMTVTLGFQMRSLELISTTTCNGRRPEHSLKVHGCSCARFPALRTVTRYHG